MKVLLASTSDIQGGAARAAYRLHTGLRQIHVNSQMLVQTKYSNNSTVLGKRYSASGGVREAVKALRVTLDHLPLKRYPKYNGMTFSPQWLPENIVPKVKQLNPDIINLHWINSGFVRIETIAHFKQPVIWTLHDMWAFTGGCHYDQNCKRYIDSCGDCPQLGSNNNQDLSYRILKRKAQAWKNIQLTVVVPSTWMAKCASSSSLFQNRQIEIIPNGLDPQLYRPVDRQIARNLLSLPQSKRLILFGSLGATSNKRKGFQLLQPALQELSKTDWHENLEIVIFGASKPDNPPEFGLRTHYLDTLTDDLLLVLAYSAADLFILPSTQENLANTVMEALACGTPCVAFNIGGMPDMIDHQENGYLAQPYKSKDLTKGIIWVLENQDRYQKLCDYARKKVEREFTLETQARCYESLFNNLLT